MSLRDWQGHLWNRNWCPHLRQYQCWQPQTTLRWFWRQQSRNERKELGRCHGRMLLRKINVIWGDLIPDWQSLEREWGLELFRFRLKCGIGTILIHPLLKVTCHLSSFSREQQKGLAFYRSGSTCIFSIWQEASLSAGLFGRCSEVREGMKFEICGH